MAATKTAQRAKAVPKIGFQRCCWRWQAGTTLERPLLQPPGLGRPAQFRLSQEASLDTCFFSHRLLHPVWRPTKRRGKRVGRETPGCLGPHGRVYPGWIFFNPKVKVFLFETSIYIPESKKKKKQGSQAPGLYLSLAASQTQHQSCAGGTFLALSPSRAAEVTHASLLPAWTKPPL